MFTMQFLELAALLVVVLFISVGVVLWLKSRKKQPNPMMQLLILVLLLVMCFAGVKWGGEALGIFSPSKSGSEAEDPYRQALILLQEPYPLYTTANNLANSNRESLVSRFLKIEQLDIGEMKLQVSGLRAMIESAPATGQPGIYNMRMTSDIQARWEELRRILQKKVERKS